MENLLEKKLKEIKNMGVDIIKHPGSDLIEIWINNVFLCQAQNMYINSHIENEARVETYYPEYDTRVNIDPYITESEDLPFN